MELSTDTWFPCSIAWVVEHWALIADWIIHSGCKNDLIAKPIIYRPVMFDYCCDSHAHLINLSRAYISVCKWLRWSATEKSLTIECQSVTCGTKMMNMEELVIFISHKLIYWFKVSLCNAKDLSIVIISKLYDYNLNIVFKFFLSWPNSISWERSRSLFISISTDKDWIMQDKEATLF